MTPEDVDRLNERARAVGAQIGWDLRFIVAPNPAVVAIIESHSSIVIFGPRKLEDLAAHEADFFLDDLESGKKVLTKDDEGRFSGALTVCSQQRVHPLDHVSYLWSVWGSQRRLRRGATVWLQDRDSWGLYMKLIRANVRRYRSIEDGGEFDVEPDVTCLVGKNESGKTAVLQALFKSAPVGRGKFDVGIDYPSRLTRERRGTEPITVTTLTYELDREEVTSVEAQFGAGVLKSPRFTVSTGYRYEGTTWATKTNASAVVQHLRQTLADLPPTTSEAVAAATTPTELKSALAAMETEPAAATAVLKTISGWRNKNYDLAIIDSLQSARPKFVYFGDYDSMPGKVSIPDLIARRDADELTRGEQALVSLLTLASATLEDFLKPDSHEHLIRDLENASNSISEEVFEFWSQNTNLSVELNIIGTAEPGAVAPLDQAPLLQIRVKNERHKVTVPFSERSRGFVWFFSFLAYFSQVEEEAEQPLILLLDEPGLNLHATAQADLLRFIDERLAPQHQVLFSTHSPFMIDAHRLNRVRTVVDDLSAGTVISADVLHTDAETAFPLHAAIGLELGQSLFVGANNLVVEGASDLLYLEVLSDALRAQGRECLDERWVITPAGGIGKLPAYVTLLGANKLNTVVLADSSLQGQRTH